MKITQDKEFKPITIVLETEEEALILFDLVRSIGGSSQLDGRNFTNRIGIGLHELGVRPINKYFSGVLTAK